MKYIDLEKEKVCVEVYTEEEFKKVRKFNSISDNSLNNYEKNDGIDYIVISGSESGHPFDSHSDAKQFFIDENYIILTFSEFNQQFLQESIQYEIY